MSDEELGLDTFITRNEDGSKSIIIKKFRGSEEMMLQLSKILSLQHFIQSEVELLELADQKNVQEVARVISHSIITNISDLCSGLIFHDKHHNFKRTSFSTTSSLHVSLRYPLKVIFQKTQIFRKENIIIITNPEKTNGHSDMLIDLDLAKEVGSGRSSAQHRTGTMEFMAIEVLLNINHTYQHDLESFFYVLIWQCVRRGWEKLDKLQRQGQPEESALRDWCTGTYQKIARSKRGDMTVDGFEDILSEFSPIFECVKPF
ncbi:serine/threonine protein kinase Sgk2 [Histoplasma capsulatum H143]|uniref:Serine/threonine protein kinase Sgk2 n=1 Tax=Ajellomyces capsulatus (strain H143) TaxID=544712 RepID=C6HKB9_AJECH|nr:serine/threonine protein kinase Sgk2 [Histoplasma capsulatum H143]